MGQRPQSPGGRPSRDLTRFAWAAAAIVAVPIVATAVRAGLDGWVPHSDMAVVAIRAADVPTRGTPLLGMGSSIGEHVPGAEVSHPGPSLFWALAPFVAVAGPAWGSLLGVAAVRLATVGALAWLAARTGRRAVVAVVMASALLCLALVEDWGGGYSSLNPITVALPFLLVVVAAWRLVDGDPWALPLLAVAATFTVQGHLSYAVVTALETAWAVVGGAVVARRDGTLDRRWRWPAALTAAALGLLWALPAYEVLIASGGNLAQMAKVPGAGIASRGWRGGLDALGAVTRGVTGGETSPSARVERGVTLGSVLGVVVLAVAARRARRRSDRSAQRFLVTAVVAAAGCALGLATTPQEPLEDLQLLWIPVTAVALVAATVVALLPDRPVAADRPLVAPVLALAVLALLALGPARPGDIRDPGLLDRAAVDAVPAVTDQVTAALPPGRYAIRADSGVRPSLVMAGLAAQLDDRGYELYVGRGDTHAFGGNRLLTDDVTVAGEIVVMSAAVPPPDDATVLARFEAGGEDPEALAAALAELEAVMQRADGLELTSEGRRRMHADLVDGFGLSPAEADAALADPSRLVAISPLLVADSIRDGFILSPTLPDDLAADLRTQVPFAVVVVERPPP